MPPPEDTIAVWRELAIKRADALRELIAAARAQHDALDNAIAMLVIADREFMPAQSPMWAAMVQGHAAILKAGKAL